MATGIINFITWNVNGLKEQRNQKFRELQNADVVFLQETHIGERDNHVLECSEDEWHVYFTKCTSARRGTAILVRKQLVFEHISDDKDTCSGYVMLKCKLYSQLYTLVSIYNHQTDTKTLDKLSRYLQLMTTGLLVIAGDFNTALNPFIDKKCHTNQVTTNRTHSKLLPCVENFMKSLQLVDVWRRRNPVNQSYTFCRGRTSSRLDYFFIPEECLWRVRSCDIRDAERPDHQPLSLEIDNVLITFPKDPQSLKRIFRRKELELSLVQTSSHELSEVDIVSAVHSLQVSDTPRPDGIPVSFYKQELQDVIPYIKMLYSSIVDGTVNMYFNKSERSPHDNSQHFFNVDYLIITTILARHLEDFLESQSEGRIPKESHHVLFTARTLSTVTMRRYFKEEFDRQTRQTNSTLSLDFRALMNLVKYAQDLPCQGCPLTPVLITLALKRHATNLFEDSEKRLVLYIFKQSVIVCVPPEDLDEARAIVRESSDEDFDILFIGDDEALELNVDSESEVEHWDRQMHADESDAGSDALWLSMYAVVTLQESEEVMVAPSNWLNTDKTRCYWPPFKSQERCTEAVRNRCELSKAGKAWEILTIHCHGEYDTYEEATKKKEELVRAQRDGMYAVITLRESKELTVIPSNWLNEGKTQCYWPPFKSQERYTDALKNRLEPAAGEKAWEMLLIDFHGGHATYEQAKERAAALQEQSEQPSTSFGSLETQNSPLRPSLSTSLEMFTDGISTHATVTSHGTKRKRDESPEISAQSLLSTDMDIRNKAKQIIQEVMKQVQAIKSTDHNTTALTHIEDAIYKLNQMDKDHKRKATIGVFGRTGVGKSCLINAVLGERYLLPSSYIYACTSVITQVEANLSDCQYKAEIVFISKEEWDNEIASCEKNQDGDNLIRETIKEKIIALYGADAARKTLNELQQDDKYTEIDKVLSSGNMTISAPNVTDFTRKVSQFIKSNDSNPGGWFWPLVKSLTVKIPNCCELLEHIVLVDIPGTGDCNKIRDELWRPKLKDCTCVWIVSDITRAVSDKDPWEILDHCMQDLGGGGECKHINFICTKTDQIDARGYLVNEQLEQMIGPKDLKTKCILHRNERAKEAVKGKLKNAGNRDSNKRFITDVFTVSSEAFLDQDNPVLESTETEIPKLRDVLKNLNKNINRELTRDYVNEAKGVLSLIQSVQLDKHETMTKARVRKNLMENLQAELFKLDCRLNSLDETLKRCLSAGVEESVRSCVETTQALMKSVRPKTNRGFHKIYRAMCEREGRYWPKNWEAPLDLNICLTQHMYDNLNEEFELMFPVDNNVKTGKSLQEDLEKFSIIQSDAAQSLWQQHIEKFIQMQEYKLKASLNRYIVEKKKEIHSSIRITIQKKMTLGYIKAAEETGAGSMDRMENIITETIKQLKHQMFNEAKSKVLEMFSDLKLNIKKTLKSELQTSVELSLSHAGKIIRLNVSREIQELERLSEQLSA